MTDAPVPHLPPDATSPEGTAARWLAAQHALAAGAAHEIKNSLNGVAVNLAVVQSRLGRGAAPETVSRFADAAVSQVDRLAAQLEALLALVRAPAPEPDVGTIVRQLAALAGPGADGAPGLEVSAPEPGAARAGTAPELTRLLVASAVGAALAGPGPAACAVTVEPDGAVRLALDAPQALTLAPELAALAAAAGVTVAAAAPPSVAGLTLTFPSALAKP